VRQRRMAPSKTARGGGGGTCGGTGRGVGRNGRARCRRQAGQRASASFSVRRRAGQRASVSSGAQRLGRRLQGSRRWAAAASSPTEADDRSGVGGVRARRARGTSGEGWLQLGSRTAGGGRWLRKVHGRRANADVGSGKFMVVARTKLSTILDDA
jgi:hypothetical protein